MAAFDALPDIQRAETTAVGAGWRELAALANDMRDRDKKTTTDVLAVWLEAARLDPENTWTWIEIARLHEG